MENTLDKKSRAAWALVPVVVEHAKEHWGKFGWDMIVECWSREEIGVELEHYGITTKTAAIRHFGQIAKGWWEHEQEAKAAGGEY